MGNPIGCGGRFYIALVEKSDAVLEAQTQEQVKTPMPVRGGRLTLVLQSSPIWWQYLRTTKEENDA